MHHCSGGCFHSHVSHIRLWVTFDLGNHRCVHLCLKEVIMHESHTQKSQESQTLQEGTKASGESLSEQQVPTVDFSMDRTGDLTPTVDLANPTRATVRVGAVSGAGSVILPQLPGYTIIGVLGRGGMGVVYQARQKGLDRLVAIKMLIAGEHAGEEHHSRFQTEAQAVATLQ